MKRVLGIEGEWKTEPVEQQTMVRTIEEFIPRVIVEVSRHDATGYTLQVHKKPRYENEEIYPTLQHAFSEIHRIGMNIRKASLLFIPNEEEKKLFTVDCNVATVLEYTAEQQIPLGHLMQELPQSLASKNRNMQLEDFSTANTRRFVSISMSMRKDMIPILVDFGNQIIRNAVPGNPEIQWDVQPF